MLASEGAPGERFSLDEQVQCGLWFEGRWHFSRKWGSLKCIQSFCVSVLMAGCPELCGEIPTSSAINKVNKEIQLVKGRISLMLR